jgi:hypothetical protein
MICFKARSVAEDDDQQGFYREYINHTLVFAGDYTPFQQGQDVHRAVTTADEVCRGRIKRCQLAAADTTTRAKTFYKARGCQNRLK